jgi:hypothetical protein
VDCTRVHIGQIAFFRVGCVPEQTIWTAFQMAQEEVRAAAPNGSNATTQSSSTTSTGASGSISVSIGNNNEEKKRTGDGRVDGASAPYSGRVASFSVIAPPVPTKVHGDPVASAIMVNDISVDDVQALDDNDPAVDKTKALAAVGMKQAPYRDITILPPAVHLSAIQMIADYFMGWCLNIGDAEVAAQWQRQLEQRAFSHRFSM